MGSGEGTGEAGAAVGLNMLEAAEDGEGCSETPQEERGNARVQCLDTKFRLQLMKTQGMSLRSKTNYGNTHMMVSYPSRVNISLPKLVKDGLSYTEAKKRIARAVREDHQRFVREGEVELAREMSLRNLQERVRNAHTYGSVTTTNKIQRMHQRGREQQARSMLKYKELRTGAREDEFPIWMDQESAKASFRRQISPIPAYSTVPSRASRELLHASSLSKQIEGGNGGDRNEDTVAPEVSWHDLLPKSGGSSAKRGIHSNKTSGGGCGVEISKANQGTGKPGTAHSVGDEAFVLRNMYTRGCLDAQQQGWCSLPPALFSTLAMQLGTLSKINMPRNNLELLLCSENRNFSCTHMRLVSEINLSGNRLRELPPGTEQLTNLRILRLDNNKLDSLPEGFLKLRLLTVLSLRHNNFSKLPYRFGDLRSLQELDLGENMLKTLPPTTGLLTSLKRLKLDGNNMPHLAVPPLFKGSDGEDQAAKWSKRWSRESKREVWIHRWTGKTSITDPTSSRSSSTENGIQGCATSESSSLVEGTTSYNARRNALAARGVYEWQAAHNSNTGEVYYINNINSVTTPVMPPCMDKVGEMANLLTLKLSRNKLRSLPSRVARVGEALPQIDAYERLSSICSCVNMEVLEANDNYLETLPTRLGDMKRLKSLRLDINCLKELPRSTVHLSRLEKLSLTSNFFATFPEFAMKMSNLRTLLLGNNQLKKLPYAVGFLSHLKNLELYNNPLVDPPAELLVLGMDAMLWECRQRHWRENRGPPPTVGVHGFGIEEEKLELQPEFDRKLAKCVRGAQRTGEINFIMEGLRHFPMALFEEEVGTKLKALRLDSNDLGAVLFQHRWKDLDGVTHTVSFQSLLVLSLKGCKLRGLAQDVAELRSLRELYLENNLIMALPDTFTRLWALEILDLKKNRIQNCPEDVGTLSSLKRLELDGNRLEVLPDSLSELALLEVLSLSSNHVYRLPDGITRLERLKAIDADLNMLSHLPPAFGELQLRSLKLSYNRLESLREDLFLPKLKETLRQLWLSNNNLLELPDSIVELSGAQEVRLDFNPFKSPPGELLSEGLPTVIKYLKERRERIDRMQDTILRSGFDTSSRYLVPEPCGVLRTETGYLDPTDLDEFDKAVDRFINGNFYQHELSTEKIMEEIVLLKEIREREFLERLVTHLMERIVFHETRDYFSKNVFCRHTTRPWGRNKRPVGCFMIALSTVLEDTEPNPFVEEFRPALWTEASKTLPKSVFDYSVESLKKGLLSLRSAYGPIASFEKATFDFCECVDKSTGQELRHPKGECVVDGLVIVKIIYTAEEADRRKAEERELNEVLMRSRVQVEGWLKTKEGRTRANDEVKKRRLTKNVRVEAITASIAELKGDLKLSRDGERRGKAMLQAFVAMLRLNLSEENRHGRRNLTGDGAIKKEMCTFAHRRKALFESGEPFHLHTISSAEEAIALVETAEKEVRDVEVEILRLDAEKTQLMQQLKARTAEMLAEAEEDLADKYCFVSLNEVLQRNRTKALKCGWRRPWDGMDGEDFEAWADSINCVAAIRRERPESVAEYMRMPEPANNCDWDQPLEEFLATASATLNWDGTDKMEQFLVPHLREWKAKRKARGLEGLDVNDPSVYDKDGEFIEEMGDGEKGQQAGDGRFSSSRNSKPDTLGTNIPQSSEGDSDARVERQQRGWRKFFSGRKAKGPRVP